MKRGVKGCYNGGMDWTGDHVGWGKKVVPEKEHLGFSPFYFYLFLLRFFFFFW